MLTRQLTFALMVVAVTAAARTATPQAYCALRDPVKQVYELFPEANSYRSIVATVGEDARAEVKAKCGFDLHFNELGRHTLYVAVRDERPIGLVHVRSEKGRWGLTEVAWALDLDLAVVDFRLQRCRSRLRDAIVAETFRKAFVGRKLSDLRSWIDAHGDLLTSAGLPVQEEARDLAASIVRCGIKTIVVSESVWKNDLALLRLLDHAYASFAGAHTIERVERVYTAEIEKALAMLSIDAGSLDRTQSTMIRVLDEGGNLVGIAYRCRIMFLAEPLDLWWNIAPDLTVTAVIPEGSWPDYEMQSAFEAAVGLTFDKVMQCATAAEMTAAEALVLARGHGMPE